jgi:hypothetical protein
MDESFLKEHLACCRNLAAANYENRLLKSSRATRANQASVRPSRCIIGGPRSGLKAKKK